MHSVHQTCDTSVLLLSQPLDAVRRNIALVVKTASVRYATCVAQSAAASCNERCCACLGLWVDEGATHSRGRCNARCVYIICLLSHVSTHSCCRG